VNLDELLNKTDSCWLWKGRIDKNGYGTYGPKVAHRVVWTLLVGKIPKGKQLNHKDKICPNRHCVNPEHLYIGTQKQNMQDRLRAGNHPMKSKTHCKRGHEFTKDNIYKTSHLGGRACATCERARSLRYYYKKKEQNASA
jgi:HNH endonuclease